MHFYYLLLYILTTNIFKYLNIKTITDFNRKLSLNITQDPYIHLNNNIGHNILRDEPVQ